MKAPLIPARWIAVFLASLFLVCGAMAQTVTSPAAPSSTLTFPVLTGPVVDEAGLLTPADRAALRDSLATLEAKTGKQFVVVTLTSLRGRTIEEYGYQLGRQWGIGRKDISSGVLLIIAPNERATRIEVGYGLEGTLTDAATKLIIETVILPRFRAGDYPDGVKRGVAQIVQILTADSQTAPSSPAPALSTPAGDVPIWLLIAVGLIFVALLIGCAVRGGAVCQFMLQLLYMMALSGGRSSNSGSSSSYSGRGGSFGGGGSSGRW